MEVLLPGCTSSIRQKAHQITPPVSVDHNYHVIDRTMAATLTKQAVLQQQYQQHHLEQSQTCQIQPQPSWTQPQTQGMKQQCASAIAPPKNNPHALKDLDHSLPASLLSTRPQTARNELTKSTTIDYYPSSNSSNAINGTCSSRHSVPTVHHHREGNIPLYPSTADALKKLSEQAEFERHTSPVPPPRPEHTTASMSPPSSDETDEPGQSPYLEPSALNMPPKKGQ